MDPQAAWTNLLDAYEANDWESACEAAEALRRWIGRGGFPPKTLDRTMNDAWHRAATLAACQFIIDERHGSMN